MNEMSVNTAGKCPVMHTGLSTGSNANQRWWPEQLNLKILNQNSPKVDPMGETFNYKDEFLKLDFKALKKDPASNEEEALKENTGRVSAQLPVEVATYSDIDLRVEVAEGYTPDWQAWPIPQPRDGLQIVLKPLA